MCSGSNTSVPQPPQRNLPRDGAHEGQVRGSSWIMQVVKAIFKCSGEIQNDLCVVGNFRECCDTDQKRWVSMRPRGIFGPW